MFSRSRDARGPTRHPSPRTAPLCFVLFSPPALWPGRLLLPRAYVSPTPGPRVGPHGVVPVPPVGRRGTHRATSRAKEDARRVRGHLALADRHRGRFLLSFPPRSSPFSFFLLGVSTSRRASSCLSLARAFIFYSSFITLMLSRESDFPPLAPCLLSLSAIPPPSSSPW